MADSGTKSGAESPTTRQEPDFDDEPAEQGATVGSGVAIVQEAQQAADAPPEEEAPPPKPPRPMSPQSQAEATLIEAFPSMDAKVVQAVLMASGGKVEPAFNALLSMSDPSYQPEQPPLQPPRPGQQPRSQLESDELYARQLAEHYQAQAQHGQSGPPLPRRRSDRGISPGELDDGERSPSFFEDELPQIRDNIKKGFADTQTKFNRWLSDFRKKFDENDEEPAPGGPQRQNFGPSRSDQLHGISKSAEANRRSADRERYDADPAVISDDFGSLELRDNEGEEGPPKPPRTNRPQANPDLFKSTPTPPQSGPVDEVDAMYRAPTPPGGKAGSKWQPLTSVAPNPETEENDPFSLGDSDEEHEAKAKDLNPEDTERLKKAAAEAGPQEGEERKGSLEPRERSGSLGTKDKEAGEVLKS